MLYFGLFWNLNSKKAAIMIYDCDDHDVGSLYCAFKKRYASAASAGFTPSMFGTIRPHSSLTLLGKWSSPTDMTPDNVATSSRASWVTCKPMVCKIRNLYKVNQ